MKVCAAVLLILVFILPVTSEAMAACAWVLWSQTGHQWPWLILDAFESHERCRATLAKNFGAREDESVYRQGDALWICLPDTIDPRGPKAGGR
jgi:hypothetical protein